jgi:CDP-glycerol glycerophosphotransferase (TagB/SpsB family)
VSSTPGSRASESIRQPWRFAWRGLIQPALGWLALGWLAAIVPKRPGRTIVIGMPGRFADNAKYLFLALVDRSPAPEVHFLGDRPDLVADLRAAGLAVLPYPSLRGLWYLLRCETVVVDSSTWVRPLRYQVLWRARKVQVWHGCPLKRIERDDNHLAGPAVPWLRRLSLRLIGRFPRYDVLLSPSRTFTERAFRSAFWSRRVIEDDYPRNVVFHCRDPRFLIGVDQGVAERVAAGRRDGLRTIVYMPTFRDTGGDAVADGALDLRRLDAFARQHALQFVFKLHPVAAGRLPLEGRSRIHSYPASADIYPLLAETDLLLTDYSSVFFDFLRTGRPVIFFPYDLEKYRREDRALYFDYEQLVPGPICRTQDEVERAVQSLVGRRDDDFAARRAEVDAWSFARRDGRTPELLRAILEGKL